MDLSPASLVAMFSVFGLGVCMSILGSVKIRLTEQLSIDDAQMGKMFSVFNISNFIFVILAGILCDVLGFKFVAIFGFIAGFIAIFMFAQAKNYGMALFGCFLLGIGGMFMNSVGNTLLANPEILFESATKSNNMGNVFFGVGAFFVPMLTAWLFQKTSYANAVSVIAVIVLIPVILAFIAAFPSAEGVGFSFAAAVQLISQPQIFMCAIALLCYIALEVSMGGWISTYMAKGVGADDTKANLVLSYFWISLMIGRLITALVIGGVLINLDLHGAWFVTGLAVFAAIMLFILTKINTIGAATTCIVLIGLAFAPMFPTIAGLMFTRTDPSLGGSGFGIIFAVGLIGAIFVPAWIGSISKGKDIKSSMIVLAGTAAILVVIGIIMG
ncbi:MFS transporter, partial [bacterium]|nr:MFS transporter [bacterium]